MRDRESLDRGVEVTIDKDIVNLMYNGLACLSRGSKSSSYAVTSIGSMPRRTSRSCLNRASNSGSSLQ